MLVSPFGFALMVLMAMHCGTSLVPLWSHNISMPALHGGYLKADKRNRLQSIISKAIRYGFLPHSFCTLDALREDSDAKLFF